MALLSSFSRIAVSPDLPRDLACAHLPLTDLGNAERWRVRFGDDFRFCDKIGWFMWDRRRRRLLSEEKDALPAEVMQSVFATIRAIRNEAALIAALGCEDPEDLTDIQLGNFQVLATARAREGWSKLERAIARAHPKNDDGERPESYQQAVDAATDFIAECEVRGQAWETMPSKRKLWSGAIEAHAKTSGGAGKLGSVAKLARAFEGIAVEPDAFDADRMAINVLNGTLRLKRQSVKRTPEEVAEGKSVWKTSGFTVVKEPHRREDLITKLAPVKYSPGASAPV